MAEKKNTSKHFKEIVKPSLTQRDILIRKDVDEYEGGTAKDVAEKVAQLLPLIRVNDFVIHREEIKYFSIEVGKTLLPRISFTFNDEYFRCRRLLTSKLDFITVYYGNTGDEYFVKQEYVLSDISTNPGVADVTFSGFLYVPEFYKQSIRAFNADNDADTSWKVIKKLCEECKIGLFTNIDDTDDAQTWLQDNCTNFEFLEHVMRHSYTSSDTRLIYFIDQYDYLNMIDLTKAYSNKELEKTKKHPMQGTKLDIEHEVILTSSRYDKDNFPFVIGKWTANMQFGSNISRLPKTIQRNEYSLSELPFTVTTGELETNTKVVDHTWYIEPITADVHKNYRAITTERSLVDTHFRQGDEISCELAWPIMLLYPYMYIKTKLYTTKVKPEYDDQESTGDVTELDPQKPEYNIEEAEEFDELHSGDYLITSIKYETISDGQDSNLQSIVMKRLPLEDIPKIKQR